MFNTTDTVRKFQHGLEPHIKPREQTNYIRRILALHVKTCVRDGSVKQPLSLVDATSDLSVSSSSDSKGVYREYGRSLNAHVTARRDFEALKTQANSARVQQPGTRKTSGNFLDDQIAILRLRQKRQKLATIQQYLDQLLEQPAASPNFLDTNRIFEGISPLPSVPQEVVNSLAVDQRQSITGHGNQPNQLEKTVLKAKLLLKREEQLLQEVKSRSRDRPDIFSNAARLAGLSATRTELISWIEAELSVASAEEPDHESEQGDYRNTRPDTSPSAIDAKLSEIKEKYSRYLACRRELVSLLAKGPGIPAPIELKPDLPSSETASSASTASIDHLLTPCIEALISFSNNQKSLISQKSHISTTLEKCTHDTCQVLGHLAEESQLLPAYPLKDSLRRRSRLADEFTVKKSDIPDLSNRIRPWVFAADAAKIANLESVAETIESGQIALEQAIKVLTDVEMLLGIVDPETEPSAGNKDTEDDVWLGTDKPQDQTTRKHTETGQTGMKKGDVWSILHGNLGLIGHDDSI